MLYAVLISFYDQRTQPEFLKYGIYERLIHVSFKGPLYLCLAKLLGEQPAQPLPVNNSMHIHMDRKNMARAISLMPKWPLRAESRHHAVFAQPQPLL